jgi:hypothetical protein
MPTDTPRIIQRMAPPIAIWSVIDNRFDTSSLMGARVWYENPSPGHPNSSPVTSRFT